MLEYRSSRWIEEQGWSANKEGWYKVGKRSWIPFTSPLLFAGNQVSGDNG